MFTIRDWTNKNCFNRIFMLVTNKDYDEWRGEYYITKE